MTVIEEDCVVDLAVDMLDHVMTVEYYTQRSLQAYEDRSDEQLCCLIRSYACVDNLRREVCKHKRPKCTINTPMSRSAKLKRRTLKVSKWSDHRHHETGIRRN